MPMNVPVLLLWCCAIASRSKSDNWELIWQDSFDGDSIDTSKWEHEVTAWGGGVSITVLCIST